MTWSSAYNTRVSPPSCMGMAVLCEQRSIGSETSIHGPEHGKLYSDIKHLKAGRAIRRIELDAKNQQNVCFQCLVQKRAQLHAENSLAN